MQLSAKKPSQRLVFGSSIQSAVVFLMSPQRHTYAADSACMYIVHPPKRIRSSNLQVCFPLWFASPSAGYLCYKVLYKLLILNKCVFYLTLLLQFNPVYSYV